ncbi:App1 family protein [Flammeovirgaceae bacterium SG7u.111]|nr:App1 family protein [Flammeovirgaceae bacterium SG7u.132]WPO34142.1 App1 family protein [Flammeovirgaceae bacterium SG7u.111]
MGSRQNQGNFWGILKYLLLRNRLWRVLRRAIYYPIKTLKYLIKKAIGWDGTPLLVPYRSFGNKDIVFFRGRVVENYGIPSPKFKDSRFRNLLSMLKRYKSPGWPDVEVKVLFEGKVLETVTDEEGFFEIYYFPEQEQDETTIWQNVTYALSVDGKVNTMQGMLNAEVLFPNSQSQFGIISDVDDTFLESHSTLKLKKVRLMALKNALTRKPLKGVPSFYRALKNGVNGEANNPFFYVSSSEWNLYEMLRDFCEHWNIPRGVFMLRDMEFSIFKFWRAGSGSHQHKLNKIDRVLTMYPDLPFILIGDSGQHDALIYEEVVMKHPHQVKAIYIRDIGNPKRSSNVLTVIQRLKEYGVEMILARSIDEMVDDALNKNFISPKSAEKVLSESDKF